MLLFTRLCLMILGQSIQVTPTEACINLGEYIEINASGASLYQWSPTDGLSNEYGSPTYASPFSTTTYKVTGYGLSSDELIYNGDFESGNEGFTSSHQYTTNLILEGTYYIGEDAGLYHYVFYGYAHGGTGNFMIVNGATSPGANVWTEQIDVTPNTDYILSTWMCNLSVGDPSMLALLQFSINGVLIGDAYSCSNELDNWEQHHVLWNSGNSETATISIVNQNIVDGGNDFGLDDISFRKLNFVDEAHSTIYVRNPNHPLPDNINVVNCDVLPEGNEWSVKIGWSSESIACNFNIPLVGDLDDDGNPEIVCCSKNGNGSNGDHTNNNEFLVFDGVSKELKATITLESRISACDGAAYGLVKLPNRKGLIIAACYDYKLRAYDITSDDPNVPYWVSDIDYGSEFGDWAVNLGFADFNSDGHPEVYVRNKIYNAETGVLLAQANSSNTGSSYAHWSHAQHNKLSAPFAANVIGNDNLELILGNEVYTVDIVNLEGQDQNVATLAERLEPPMGIIEDGNTQVSDFNLDGYLDIFISVRDTEASNGTVYAYVWDIHNDMVSEPLAINTTQSGKSIPLITNIDNDGLSEMIIQCGVAGTDQKYQAYKYNPDTRTFVFIWAFAPDEDSYSNGITSFDFNQDGLLELIMCDQSTLRIVNGSGISHITHNDTIPVYIIRSFPFSEVAKMQYPVIVDADDDGNAEIVSVGSDKLNILESDGSPWAPTRKVWNQYMYNVTNVNNDLTITQFPFNNAMPFINPDGVILRPYNNFLQQVTAFDQYGRPYIPAADVSINNLTLDYNKDEVLLNVVCSNDGDRTLFGPFSIMVFENNYGGDIIKSHSVNKNLGVGDNRVFPIHLEKSDICGNNDLKQIVVAINCTKEGVAQNVGLQPECDIVNNLYSIDVKPTPNTQYINKTACDFYEWHGNIYHESGVYNHTVPNDNGCDSLIVLNLTIIDAPQLIINGLTNIAATTDVWPGIYNYCLSDSLELADCDINWSCSNKDWKVLPPDSRYWFTIIARTLGTGIITATVNCESGCIRATSLFVTAGHIGVNENIENLVEIYPNPANNNVFIKAEQLKQIIIYNCYGQQIIVKNDINMENEININVENLSNGIYLADITTTKGKITKRIIISK